MKIILFDVGNVVIQVDHSITNQVLEAYDVPKENMRLFFENGAYRAFSRGLITGENFYQTLIDQYLKYPLTYSQVVNAHNSHIYGVDKGVLKILSGLQKTMIAFVTDTNQWQTDREKQLVDLTEYSSIIFRSHISHKLKTDSDCFPFIIKKLDIKPKDILLVDDSLENLDSARTSGIRGLQFTGAEKLREELEKLLQ